VRKSRIPLREYPAERIALIKPSALGDIIHSLPVLSALRQRYPAAAITWVVNRAYAPLLRGHPDLDDTLVFDRSAIGASWLRACAAYQRFCRQLRDRRFDLVIDLQGLLRSGVMTWASRAERRVGLSTAREGATWFYNDVVPVKDFNAIHAVDRYWLVAQALGVGDGPKTFRVFIGETERQWAAATLREYPRPWMAIGPGSRWVTKRWLPGHFADIARRAQERFGGTAVFIGGSDEQHLSEEVARRLGGATLDLTGRTTLPQLAALLDQADVMVANDTGPLHLAAALGRPLVAPYTCTRVALNGPFGAEAGAVETRIWCRGSYITKCSRLECMSELTPDRVWPILKETLERWERARRSA
jgi:lipopolysaccharide heptosyltransferase I